MRLIFSFIPVSIEGPRNLSPLSLGLHIHRRKDEWSIPCANSSQKTIHLRHKHKISLFHSSTNQIHKLSAQKPNTPFLQFPSPAMHYRLNFIFFTENLHSRVHNHMSLWMWKLRLTIYGLYSDLMLSSIYFSYVVQTPKHMTEEFDSVSSSIKNGTVLMTTVSMM